MSPASVVLLTALIVATGAVLRLVLFDLMEFKVDEVEALRLARDALASGIPQHGMMSGVGIRNPPGFIDLLVPVVALGASPLAAGLWIAAFGIASIALMCQAGRMIGSVRAGLWAGCLMAVHPWLVLYSRKIWAQSLLPFFVALLLLVVLHCLRRPRSRAVFWVAPLACLTWQIHYSAYAVLIFVAVWYAHELWRRRLHVPMALAGVVAAALMVLPYVIYLADTGYADIRASLAVGDAQSGVRSAATTILVWGSTAFAGGLGYPFRFGLGSLAVALGGPWSVILEVLSAGATLVVVVCAACTAVSCLRPGRAPAALPEDAHFLRWLVLLAALPLLLYLVRGIRTPPHYFVVGLPPLLLLAGVGLERIASSARPRLSLAAGAFVALTGMLVALCILLAIRRDGGTAGDYGITFAAQRAAAQALVDAGVAPDAVDARSTRDKSSSVLFLMAELASRAPVVPGRSAILIDRLRTPAHVRPFITGSIVRIERHGPLEITIVEEPR